MFVVYTVDDTVRIFPAEQRKPLPVALAEELNKKYANKIKPRVGLCIRVLDVLECGEGLIHACLDGSAMYNVSFRLIVFKPFVGEILVGKVLNASPDGLRGSSQYRNHMEFFDDILIPSYMFKPNSSYNKAQGQWVWQYTDEESGEVQNMDIERDELIRFRVEVEHFNEVRPMSANAIIAGNDQKRPAAIPGSTTSPVALTPVSVSSSKNVRASAFWLECSISDDGLGLLSWWSG
ncbi:DNA-directed RNA polymerase III subunit rpc25 [Physocladia obscura]|uniref:DNA-directed RNA polymerase III subunit rpc25 n=1 Tax=Physocladia obscura TaxID=109957 RepID=A0AAD5T935_9FUNG|nr:DNA-directed RNA polymerase III subunit rpc25 [Physocladia obscura]